MIPNLMTLRRLGSMIECREKNGYRTREEAEAAALYERTITGQRLWVYECRYQHEYHLTSTKPARQRYHDSSLR